MSSKIHKVVVVCDSFKECLTSLQVAEGVEAGILKCNPECEVVKVSSADGGEGTVNALYDILGGRRISLIVEDPLARPVLVEYVILPDEMTAVMEMASSCGLALLSQDEKNPMETSTYGFGQMISDALDRGCRRFLLCIGGSATNDGEMGMLSALGWRFLDSQGNVLSGTGRSLGCVAAIDDSGVRKDVLDAEFTVACDVDSPFCGLAGAAHVYGPQKGADIRMIETLDAGMVNFAKVVQFSCRSDIRNLRRAGAAGGLGGALKAFLGADLRSGAEVVLDFMGFCELVADADMVVTGEGRIDRQTFNGKLPYAVAQRASAYGIPIIAVCGESEITEFPGVAKIIPVTPHGMPLSMAMPPATASSNISSAVASFINTYQGA